MTHDPLCLSFVYIVEGGTACNCAEIAQIRADERRLEAERRAKKFGVWHDAERDLP